MAKTDFSSSSPLAGSFFADRFFHPPPLLMWPTWPALAYFGLWGSCPAWPVIFAVMAMPSLRVFYPVQWALRWSVGLIVPADSALMQWQMICA